MFEFWLWLFVSCLVFTLCCHVVVCLGVSLVNGSVYCAGLDSLAFYRLLVAYFCG